MAEFFEGERARQVSNWEGIVFGRVDVPWQEVNRLRRGEVDLGFGLMKLIFGQI